MYTDNLYNLLKTNAFGWTCVALSYAVFFYIFNSLACLFFGGISKVSRFRYLLKSIGINGINKKKRTFKYIKIISKQYLKGGQQRLREFQSDKLSWLWPITILAIPVALYGYSHIMIEEAILSLLEIGINFYAYQTLPIKSGFQFFLWGLAFIFTINGFYRYQFQRSKKNWFSKSITHSFIQALLINAPLTFIIISLLFLWINFAINIFFLLSDNTLVYPIFHPDLMYGLKGIYNAIIAILASIAIGSFLPTVVLLREKSEHYSKIYYFLIYGGLVLLFSATASLVYIFDVRVEAIQEGALRIISTSLGDFNLHSSGQQANQAIANLYYFFLVSNLSNTFPIPSWVSLVLSIRSIALVYEVSKLLTPHQKQTSLLNFIDSILSR